MLIVFIISYIRSLVVIYLVNESVYCEVTRGGGFGGGRIE